MTEAPIVTVDPSAGALTYGLVPFVKVERANGEAIETAGLIELEPGRDYVVSIDRERFRYRKVPAQPQRRIHWTEHAAACAAAVASIYVTTIWLSVADRPQLAASIALGILACLAAAPFLRKRP